MENTGKEEEEEEEEEETSGRSLAKGTTVELETRRVLGGGLKGAEKSNRVQGGMIEEMGREAMGVDGCICPTLEFCTSLAPFLIRIPHSSILPLSNLTESSSPHSYNSQKIQKR